MDEPWLDEGDEEAQYILIETAAPNLLAPGTHIGLKELHTAAPVLVVNGATYEGHYEDALGSTLVYQEGAGPTAFTYMCSAEKKLRFEKVVAATVHEVAAVVEAESAGAGAGAGAVAADAVEAPQPTRS